MATPRIEIVVDQIIALHRIARFDVDRKAAVEAIQFYRECLRQNPQDKASSALLSILVAFKQWQNEEDV